MTKAFELEWKVPVPQVQYTQFRAHNTQYSVQSTSIHITVLFKVQDTQYMYSSVYIQYAHNKEDVVQRNVYIVYTYYRGHSTYIV
jgi:hypothetical protein